MKKCPYNTKILSLDQSITKHFQVTGVLKRLVAVFFSHLKDANIFKTVNTAPMVPLLHFCPSVFTFIELCKLSMRSDALACRTAQNVSL